MRAGKLRHSVTIQERKASAAQDAYGAPADTWSTFAPTWASITPIGGSESVIAGRTEAQATHEIRTRWMSGLLPTMRVVYGDRTFNIISATDEEERNREWLLICREVVA